MLIALTFPAALTVATELLLLLHVTLLFTASEGETLAVKVTSSPADRTVFAGNETPVGTLLTVTLHVAVLPPLAVLTVMVALPFPVPVTFPELSTVAAALLLLLHVTALFDAFAGSIVALSADELPLFSANVVGLSETDVTGISVTVTRVFAVFPPSEVLAVMVALPTCFPVTTPLESTVATEVELLVHVMPLFVAHGG
jgi:hypothetical protein